MAGDDPQHARALGQEAGQAGFGFRLGQPELGLQPLAELTVIPQQSLAEGSEPAPPTPLQRDHRLPEQGLGLFQQTPAVAVGDPALADRRLQGAGLLDGPQQLDQLSLQHSPLLPPELPVEGDTDLHIMHDITYFQ